MMIVKLNKVNRDFGEVRKNKQKINKLANEIMHEIDGLLDGDEVEKKIFRTARRIAKLSE